MSETEVQNETASAPETVTGIWELEGHEVQQKIMDVLEQQAVDYESWAAGEDRRNNADRNAVAWKRWAADELRQLRVRVRDLPLEEKRTFNMDDFEEEPATLIDVEDILLSYIDTLENADEVLEIVRRAFPEHPLFVDPKPADIEEFLVDFYKSHPERALEDQIRLFGNPFIPADIGPVVGTNSPPLTGDFPFGQSTTGVNPHVHDIRGGTAVDMAVDTSASQSDNSPNEQ